MNDYTPMSRTAIIEVLAMLSATDGQPRGEVDNDLWLGIAHQRRWRAREVRAAVTIVAAEWEPGPGRTQILPGTVVAVVARERRQPPPFAIERERQARVNVTAAPQRAALIASWAAGEVTRKSIGGSPTAPGSDHGVPSHANPTTVTRSE